MNKGKKSSTSARSKKEAEVPSAFKLAFSPKVKLPKLPQERRSSGRKSPRARNMK